MEKLIVTATGAVIVKALIEAVFRRGMSGVTRVGRWLRRNYESPGSREKLLKSLFLPDDDGHYILAPATHWKPAFGQAEPLAVAIGYPHDIAALEPFKALVPRETDYWSGATTSLELRPTTGLICTGSAKANDIVRTFLPSIHLESTGESIRYGAQGVEDLPYVFAEDETAPRVKVYSKMHEGQIVEKTRKKIFAKEGNQQRPWVPPTYNDSDWLTSDFLLVSRVPTTNLGGSLLALSGGHGAGTEAVSHLFDGRIHISALKDLADFLDGKPYWQFVLEVTSVNHQKDGTVAERVVISERLPPQVLDMNASSLPDTWKLRT